MKRPRESKDSRQVGKSSASKGKVLSLPKKPQSDGDSSSEEGTPRRSQLSPSLALSMDDMPELSLKRMIVRLLADNQVCMIFPNFC